MEYEEGYDLKKVGALILGIILAVIVVSMFIGLINIQIPEITIPEMQTEQAQQTNTEPETMQEPPQPTPISPVIQVPEDIENKRELIKPEYEKYLDFGLSVDDIVDIQFLSCEILETEDISQDPKFVQIFKQRLSEC